MKHVPAVRLSLIIVLIASCFLGCSRDPNVRKRKYFESGQRYYDKGKYKEAAIQFTNATQIDPNYAEAHYQLAQTALKTQNWNVAYQELDKTVQLQPDNLQAHLDLANLLIIGREYQQSQEHIDIVLAKDPRNAQAHSVEANLKDRQNDTNGALQEMQKAIELAPDRWDSYLNLALLQVKMNLADAAETSFKKAISLNSQATSAELALGYFYQQRNRATDAEQTFRHAMQVDSKNADPRAALARLYISQGKKAEAEQLLKQTKSDLPDNPAAYRMLGDYYFAMGDVDKAVAEYASLHQQHSSDLQVKKNYIQILILRGRLDEANKLNDEILKNAAADSEALIYRGQIQVRQGHPSQAAESLQQALNSDTENPIAHYHLGVAFDQMGNLARAESEWREAVRLNPGLVDAQKALAAAEMRRNDWEALNGTAGHLVETQPGNPDGYVLRAMAEINRGQESKGEGDIRKAIEIAPQSPVGYIHLGNLRARQKQYAEAQKAYEQALEKDANASDALAGIVNTFLSQNQPQKAVTRIQAQLAKQPSNSNYHFLLGAVLFNNKDLKGAEAELRRSVDLDKSNAEAQIKLGQVQTAQGQVDQAISTYQAYIADNPRDIRFYILTGELYESKKDWAKAKDVYQKVLQIQPDNPLASNNLAYVMLQEGGNVDMALSMAQVARRGMPQSPNAADTLGWAYYKKGAYGSALDLFKEAVKLNKDNSDEAVFHYHLGLAYAKTDQRALAKQQFERALKINPTFSDADDARKLLSE
jgi:tetratricopeptide (TPR) repeat protein